jgi:uridine kinase
MIREHGHVHAREYNRKRVNLPYNKKYWYNPAAQQFATIAQSVEQTFRKRQVKSSNLFGGLVFFLPGPEDREKFLILSEYNHHMAERFIPLVIGIAGGSGSGKTTVAQTILQRVGPDRISFLQHDAYYKDLSGLPPAQRAEVNFDHPNSLENELLIWHVQQLLKGVPVEVPIYDFSTHSRTDRTFNVKPRSVILVEGILLYTEATLRELFDVKIFVDTDSDLRFIRRLNRDITERGRTTESVIKQYLSTVRPMHLDFVEPSKRYADVIIPEGGFNTAALDMVVARIESMLTEATN